MSNHEVFIHPTAIVDSQAKLGIGVSIGPYSIIGAEVELGDHCKVHSHVVLDGKLIVGHDNSFFQFASIGAPPQDHSYKNDPTRTIIGDNNIFREYVSIHRGTLKQEGKTVLGSNCMVMAHAHLGHDVVVEDRVILVNSVNLAGHVKIGEKSIISGATNISQFITIGRGSFIGGLSGVDRDIPPYCTALGNHVRLKGINIVGLRRQGIEKPLISELVDFYRTMESSALSPRAFVENKQLMEDFQDNILVKELVQFISKSEIGVAPFIS